MCCMCVRTHTHVYMLAHMCAHACGGQWLTLVAAFLPYSPMQLSWLARELQGSVCLP